MSVTDAVQAALVQALRADAALAALVGDRVFDRVPSEAAMPYVSLGPEDWLQERGDCLEAVDGTVQIDVWSREPGRRETKAVMDRVCRLLHRAELVLMAPSRAVMCEVALRRVMTDPDGLTSHGVVQLRILAEETE